MKKFLAIFLTLTLVLGMAAVPAFAAGETPTGSITINNVTTTDKTVYEIYQLLDLESYSTTSGAYSYKVNSAWSNFFGTADALRYVAIDNSGYVTWTAAEDDATVASFAKIALAYAKDNNIKPVKSSKNAGEFVSGTNDSGEPSGTFSGLALGYYLVDSTVGALCGLTTTNPDASINAKNAAPTIDKQVKEDSTGQWGNSNTADIGQTVEFRVTVNVHAGAQNYVLHDIMDAGLTYKGNIKVEHIVPGTTTEDDEVSKDNYEIITENLTDDCTLEIRFNKEFCDSLETNDKLVIYYDAVLNSNAVIAGDGNENTAFLTFGEGHQSIEDSTKTKTYGIDIVKTDSQNKLIDGAEFKIYDAATDGNEVPVVLMNDGVDDGVTYRRAGTDEGVSIVVKDGKVRVVGLDNGTYYLEETKAPAGYNQLSARQKFIVADGNLDATFNGDTFSTGSGVHVVNKTGSMLPETGGFGTTMFILIGGFAVLAAGVLLFVNKRMSKIAE